MSQKKFKIMLTGGVALAIVAALAMLNRPERTRQDTKSTKAPKEIAQQQRSRPARFSHGGIDEGKDTVTTALASGEKKKTYKDYGLPELNAENADINPERPPDMPIGDWEEYERRRQQIVEEKAFKYRETDPSKVVPYEVAEVVPEAAKKFNIPPDLLAALLYTSSDGGHHYVQHDIEGGYGLMMLKQSPQCNTLKEAADLLGVSEDELIYNQRLNVQGGAAVLRQYYEDAVATGVTESEAWYMAVAQYSGRPQPELAAALADQVAGNLMKGFEIDSEDGSGYFKQDGTKTPLFYPKNWKVAAVDPPAGLAQTGAEKTSTQPPAGQDSSRPAASQ